MLCGTITSITRVKECLWRGMHVSWIFMVFFFACLLRFLRALCLLCLCGGVAWALPAAGQKVMVVSESSQATQVGLSIARQGGNVVDVAVAVGLALAVGRPQYGALGGGGFALLKVQGQVKALDFRETAPAATHAKFYSKRPEASLKGPLSVGVPGTAYGLYEMHKRWGKLKWAKLFDPVLDLAERGERVSLKMHQDIRAAWPRLNSVAKKYLGTKGKPKKPGELFRVPPLVKALKLYKKKNTRAFYEGAVARDIVQTLAKLSGETYMSLEDLAAYKVRELKPMQVQFVGHRIYLMPPPSSGGVVMSGAFSLVQRVSLSKVRPRSALESHLMAEVLKAAFRGRALLADPDYHKNPVRYLLSTAYLQGLAQSISKTRPSKTAPLTLQDLPKGGKGEGLETTHYVVMDRQGNGVSVTHTLNSSFGSGIFTNQYAINLNNEMNDFTLQPGKPNQFGLVQSLGNTAAKGKRPLSSMSPVLIERAGKLHGALGGKGGPRIISAVFQSVYNLLVRGLDIERAINTPRVHHQFLPNKLFIESPSMGFEQEQALKKLGHKVVNVPGGLGKVFGVFRSDGLLMGAYDHRGEGLALGY